MRMIDGIPQVLTGEAFYPHVKVPVPNFSGDRNGYEINLAVSDEVYEKFIEIRFKQDSVR